MDALWRAVADPTRRRLIELLRDGPRTTGDLCRAFGVSRFAVMKHLKVLERNGVIRVRREGRQRWNSLEAARLAALGGRWTLPSAPPGGVPPPAQQPSAARVRELFIDAVPWRVFDALTVNLAGWWGAPFLRAADASNLVLEPHPGGRFYEEWGHRQGALRGLVTAIRQDECLEVAGRLFDAGADAVLGFRLEAREGGTLVQISSGLEDELFDELFRRRLKVFLEQGVRSGIGS